MMTTGETRASWRAQEMDARNYTGREASAIDERAHHFLWILVSTPKPPFWSRTALIESRGPTWYSNLMVWFCVEVTSVANVTKILLVTRCCTAMCAPGFCWFPPSTGSMESCEMPANFSTRLVIWLETCDAMSDSAPSAPGGVGFAALASDVLPKAIRLMMSEGGSAGSDE